MNLMYGSEVPQESWKNHIIVYYDVGYLNIGFIGVVLMKVWLEANHWYPIYGDYKIRITEVKAINCKIKQH